MAVSGRLMRANGSFSAQDRLRSAVTVDGWRITTYFRRRFSQLPRVSSGCSVSRCLSEAHFWTLVETR